MVHFNLEPLCAALGVLSQLIVLTVQLTSQQHTELGTWEVPREADEIH